MSATASFFPWKDLPMDLLGGIRARTEQLLNRAIAEGRAQSARDFSIKAGLAKGHVRDLINGKMEPSLSTLERVAAFGQVSLEQLIFGREAMPPRPLVSEVDDHPSPAFGPAARAFLELQQHSADAEATVRAMLGLRFNAGHAWTPAEWFEELSFEFKRRSRGLGRTG